MQDHARSYSGVPEHAVISISSHEDPNLTFTGLFTLLFWRSEPTVPQMVLIRGCNLKCFPNRFLFNHL
jgi:hypothetical protein